MLQFIMLHRASLLADKKAVLIAVSDIRAVGTATQPDETSLMAGAVVQLLPPGARDIHQMARVPVAETVEEIARLLDAAYQVPR